MANQFSNKPDDVKRKIFIGGLSQDTDADDLYHYFGKYGELERVDLKSNMLTRRHRGFAFVTFVDEKTAEEVLNSSPHIIRERVVDLKPPKNRSSIKKIFVGGIDGDLSNTEIKHYFEQFGTVENIERPFDRQRNRSREFCFIIFRNSEAVETAISLPKQVIGGRECDIKLANPNRNNYHQNMHNGMNRGRGGPQNAFFKNRNQNINSNWRNEQHQNGNYRGSNNDKPYNDTHFLTNIDTIQPTYKPTYPTNYYTYMNNY